MFGQDLQMLKAKSFAKSETRSDETINEKLIVGVNFKCNVKA